MAKRQLDLTPANPFAAAFIGVIVNRLAMMLLIGLPMTLVLVLGARSTISYGSLIIFGVLAALMGSVMCGGVGVAFARISNLSKWGFAAGAAANTLFVALDALLRSTTPALVQVIGSLALPVAFLVAARRRPFQQSEAV